MDPLRALFLELGVDDKQAVLALENVTRSANSAERALLGVAQATKMTGGATALTRSNDALARSYGTVSIKARQAAADLSYLARAQFQVGRNVSIQSGGSPMAGQAAQGILAQEQAYGSYLANQGRVAALTRANQYALGGRQTLAGPAAVAASQRGGRGNYGLGTSIFLATLGIGAASYGFSQAGNLQRSSLLASYASGQSPAAMRAQTMGLDRAYALRLAQGTALTQEVAQLGAMTPEGQRQIAQAGAGFNILESQVGASEASAAIYRLIKATTRSKEEFDAGTRSATRYAGAIYAAGNESAAGASEVFAMVQELEPLAQMMHLGADGTIALSAAFADLNANQRELFRGALTRMTIQGKLDPNNPIGSLLSIAERLRAAGTDAEKLNILKSLGFTNIRDVQTVSVMAASMDTFARSLAAVNTELHGTSTFDTKIGEVLGTMSGQWDALKSSMDGAAASIMGSLAPALGILLALLTGVADTISAHPALAMLVGIGAMGLAGLAVRGAYRRHFAGPAIAQVLASKGISEGEHMAASYALAGTMPFAGSYAERFATTGIGMSMARGIGKGATAGVGRMSRLSLGLMNALPFGERIAGAAAARMAAGGIAGSALEIATGPIGWVVMALSLGAPLFERIGSATAKMASQGGALGVVLNTVSLIFDVLAAGGRILNTIFGWIGTSGKWLLNMATFGHADDVLHGINTGLVTAQHAVTGFDNGKPGGSAPSAPGSVNIYTDGSRSGYQMAIDEVGRRSARTMPNTYGGIPI